jgi:hypothetical protein
VAAAHTNTIRLRFPLTITTNTRQKYASHITNAQTSLSFTLNPKSMAKLKYFYDLLSQPSRAVYIFLKLNNIPHQACPVALRSGEFAKFANEELKQQLTRSWFAKWRKKMNLQFFLSEFFRYSRSRWALERRLQKQCESIPEGAVHHRRWVQVVGECGHFQVSEISVIQWMKIVNFESMPANVSIYSKQLILTLIQM